MSSFLFSSLHYIGRFLFACVLLLSLAMSFSLPLSSNLYIIRTHLDGAAVQTSKGLSVTGVSEIRVSITASYLIMTKLVDFFIICLVWCLVRTFGHFTFGLGSIERTYIH